MSTWTADLTGVVLGAAFVVACCGIDSARAQEVLPKTAPSKQQSIGVASGFAIGAAAAGPVGAIAGAAAGGWLGERFHRQASAREALQADLEKAAVEQGTLAARLAVLNGSLAEEQSRSGQLDLALKSTDQLATVIHFRTNDDTVEESAIAPLQRLGEMAAALKDASLRLEGYADSRGSDAFNLALSQRRAEAVAEILGEAGVPADRLVIEARGKADSTCDPGDADGLALDRRVSVTLERGQLPTVVRNP